MNISIKLKDAKRCSCCGKLHTHTSGDLQVSYDETFNGVYWNCECKSTLFVPLTGIASDELDFGGL